MIKPSPDFKRLEKVLTRSGGPDRVVFYELFSDIESEVLTAIDKNIPPLSSSASEKKQRDHKFKQHIRYMYNLGYDYINIGRNWDFPKMQNLVSNSGASQRAYVTSEVHVISNQEDFERYQWPDVESIDYCHFKDVESVMPEGMKVIALCAGILENVMLLLGHEGISYLLFDDPDLVEKVFEMVAETLITYYDKVASFDSVAALSLSDDMGFKTQTMLSPDTYRKLLFPWHKKLINVIHGHGKLAILHSCGKLDEVMEDIIDCGWDAKHSFEDEIMPVWEAQEKYGDRISLLGGFDMDKICNMAPGQVQEHTRMLIDKCASKGGWALGTGNSVADYVPVENFLAMLNEATSSGE